jgi:tetratricopeptide (TPR) repeat protein
VTHPVQLQLRYVPAPPPAADAWFLPGDIPARWLEELVRAGLARMETRLFVVPQSMDNGAVAGLLVVPERPEPGTTPPAGLPCRRVGERLYLPHDAELQPPIADEELRRLLPLPISFYHPVFGLSGFETGDTLRVSDLILAPGESPGTWNFARAGSAPVPALSALVLLQPPSIEDLFGRAPEDIGSEPMMDLPPAPDEPADNLAADANRKLRWMFAKGLSEMMRHMPHAGAGPNWLNQIGDWAGRQLQGVNRQLEELRNKELNRLLHLLDKDPEEGLRRAIPMNSFAHRGIAPPGDRLGLRSLNFDPAKMGGRPADFWNVPVNLQEVLRRRYREMADREMQLGRHRRAAYIYAELLGDLVSAANAFKRGGLFREAALLYEEHLRNPLEAAVCFSLAGLLPEAIERFEKLGQWLMVADLQERAGNPAAAAAAIRKVVAERLANHDAMGAAKLLDERLRAPDEALDLLLKAWPDSPQAAAALRVAFQLLARLGRHEVASEILSGFERGSVPNGLAFPLMSVLAATAGDYPHGRVRQRAADLARVLIAGQLQQPGFRSEEARHLLEHLVCLAPQDRIVLRDVNRYVANLSEAELLRRRAARAPAAGNKPEVRKTFELPRQIQWLYLRCEWHWFFAMGVTPKRLTVVRGVWDGEYQSLSWECPGVTAKQGFIFEPTGERGKALAMARAGASPFPSKIFPAADAFFSQECTAGTPGGLPTQGYPFAFGEDAVWSVHVTSGRAVLSCRDKTRGHLLRTVDVTQELLTNTVRDEKSQLLLTVVTNTVAVALGNRLVVATGDGSLSRVELPGERTGADNSQYQKGSGGHASTRRGDVLAWQWRMRRTGQGRAIADRCVYSRRPAGAGIGPKTAIAGFGRQRGPFGHSFGVVGRPDRRRLRHLASRRIRGAERPGRNYCVSPAPVAAVWFLGQLQGRLAVEIRPGEITQNDVP